MPTTPTRAPGGDLFRGTSAPGRQKPRDIGSMDADVFHVEEFDLKDERGVGRDDAARALSAVAEMRRDGEFADAADLHRRDALIPALDNAAPAERERERLSPVARTVEFLPV